MLELHPDKNQKEKNGDKFKIISEAYHYLKKEHKLKNSNRQNIRKTKQNSNQRQKHRRNPNPNLQGKTCPTGISKKIAVKFKIYI